MTVFEQDNGFGENNRLASGGFESTQGCAFALVCGAPFNAAHFQQLVQDGFFDTVVAVDSGYRHLAAIGYEPDAALGDFDSLGYFPEAPLVRTHPAVKDESDLELALRWAREQGASEIVVYGCLGGRIDHTISALQLLARTAEHGCRVSAVGSSENSDASDPSDSCGQVVQVLVGPGSLELYAPDDLSGFCVSSGPNEDEGARTFATISLFSANSTACDVSAQGVFYPLDHANMTNRSSLGLSNEMTSRKSLVTVGTGTLLVVHPDYIFARYTDI